MLFYDKKFIASSCEEYIKKTKQIVCKNDSTKYKYKKLLLLKYEFKCSGIYNKLPYDYKKFITFFIDWNLEFYERLIDNVDKNKITKQSKLKGLLTKLVNTKIY